MFSRLRFAILAGIILGGASGSLAQQQVPVASETAPLVVDISLSQSQEPAKLGTGPSDSTQEHTVQPPANEPDPAKEVPADKDTQEPTKKPKRPWNEFIDNKAFTMRLDMVILFDWTNYSQDANSEAQVGDLSDKYHLRAGRVILDGQFKFEHPWTYIVGVNYNGIDRPASQKDFAFTDLALGIPLGKFGTVSVGTQREGVSQIMPALGAVPLKDLDTFKCQQFVYALANPAQRKKIKTGLSEPVIKRCRTMLKAICEMAVDMEFLHKNPARKLTIPDCKVTSKPTLPGDTLRTLLDAITDPRDHLVMLIGVFCAVRPSELFGLKWSAHDGDKLFIRSTAWKGKLYEGKTKTRKSRAPIYLSSLIACEIDRWKKLCPDSSPDALMFPTANGTPLEARNFLRDCVKPIVARINAQLEKRNRPAIAGPITFQVLRRSAATRNQKHGTMKDVQQLMRHSSIETTAEVYMQPIPESVKQMVEMDLAEVMGQQQLLELHSDQLDMTWPEKAETERIQ